MTERRCRHEQRRDVEVEPTDTFGDTRRVVQLPIAVMDQIGRPAGIVKRASQIKEAVKNIYPVSQKWNCEYDTAKRCPMCAHLQCYGVPARKCLMCRNADQVRPKLLAAGRHRSYNYESMVEEV